MSSTINKGKPEFSRRQFIGLAGGAVSMAALASLGIRQGWSNKQENEIDSRNITLQENQADVLVIGGGIAGLFAAVKAYDAGASVLMVSKGRLGSSGQTPFAKGIFSYDPAAEEYSIDEFVAAVSRSALNTNNPVYTRQLAENSMARVDELRSWGFFESPLYNKAFSKPVNERGIPLMERIMITNLIKQNGRISGAAGFGLDDAAVHVFTAKSVILCTGAGGFKPNGFPICDLTHDGTVMAYNIGAKVTGKEWNDGHPGRSENPAACFDGWHGMFEQSPGTTGIGIRHDLGVDSNYSAYMLGNPVVGGHDEGRGETVEGGPYRPAEFQERRGPGGPPPGADGQQGPPRDNRGGGDRPPPRDGGKGPGGGGPPGMGGTPVGGSSAGMSIHKAEGLVPINENCESTIPGLYAAGDALGSYMVGAIYTQIGSSLAGSAVQGAVAAEAAAAYSRNVEALKISQKTVAALQDEILAPLEREAGYSPAWVTQTLQGIMIPNFVLYIQKEKIMNAALAYVEELRDHHVPMLRASDMHELRLAHETANMVMSAEMKLRASLFRTESRCSHYRLDYPDVDYENWEAWINLYKGRDGQMTLEKQAFGSWPEQS